MFAYGWSGKLNTWQIEELHHIDAKTDKKNNTAIKLSCLLFYVYNSPMQPNALAKWLQIYVL